MLAGIAVSDGFETAIGDGSVLSKLSDRDTCVFVSVDGFTGCWMAVLAEEFTMDELLVVAVLNVSDVTVDRIADVDCGADIATDDVATDNGPPSVSSLSNSSYETPANALSIMAKRDLCAFSFRSFGNWNSVDVVSRGLTNRRRRLASTSESSSSSFRFGIVL